MDVDDEIEINLLTTQEIGERLVILGATLRRWLLEEVGGEESPAELFDLQHWLIQEQLRESMLDEEQWIIDTPLGQLTDDDANFELIAESLATLAWAVNLVPTVPAADQLTPIEDLLDQLPAPWDSIQPFITSLALRSEEEIAAQIETAELWLWRFMIEEERKIASRVDRIEIEATIHETVLEAKKAGLISATRANDFALGTTSFARANLAQQDLTRIISTTRLQALNWMCRLDDFWFDDLSDEL